MNTEDRKMGPLEAIRAKCLDCCGGQVREVRHCPSRACPLHPYRSGRAMGASLTMNTDSEKEKLDHEHD